MPTAMIAPAVKIKDVFSATLNASILPVSPAMAPSPSRAITSIFPKIFANVVPTLVNPLKAIFNLSTEPSNPTSPATVNVVTANNFTKSLFANFKICVPKSTNNFNNVFKDVSPRINS